MDIVSRGQTLDCASYAAIHRDSIDRRRKGSRDERSLNPRTEVHAAPRKPPLAGRGRRPAAGGPSRHRTGQRRTCQWGGADLSQPPPGTDPPSPATEPAHRPTTPTQPQPAPTAEPASPTPAPDRPQPLNPLHKCPPGTAPTRFVPPSHTQHHHPGTENNPGATAHPQRPHACLASPPSSSKRTQPAGCIDLVAGGGEVLPAGDFTVRLERRFRIGLVPTASLSHRGTMAEHDCNRRNLRHRSG